MCSLVITYRDALQSLPSEDGAFLASWQPRQFTQQRQRFIEILQSLIGTSQDAAFPKKIPNYLLKFQNYLSQGFSVQQSYQLLDSIDKQQLHSDIQDTNLLKQLLQCNWDLAICEQELLALAKEKNSEPLLKYLVTGSWNEVVREQAKNKLLALHQQGPWNEQLYQTIVTLPDHVFSWQGIFGLGTAFIAERWVGNILVQQGVRSIAKIQSATFATENIVFSGLGTVQLYADQDLVKEDLIKLWGTNLITLGLLRLSRFTSQQVHSLIHQPAGNGMALRAWEWQSLTRVVSANTLGLLALSSASYVEYQVGLRTTVPSWHAALLHGLATHIAAQGAGAFVHAISPQPLPVLENANKTMQGSGEQLHNWSERFVRPWIEEIPASSLQPQFAFAVRVDPDLVRERFENIYRHWPSRRKKIDEIYDLLIEMGWPEARAQFIIAGIHRYGKNYENFKIVLDQFKQGQWPHQLQWRVLNPVIHIQNSYPHNYRLWLLNTKIRDMTAAKWTAQQQTKILVPWAKRSNDHLYIPNSMQIFKDAGWNTQDELELALLLFKYAKVSMRSAMWEAMYGVRYFNAEKFPVKMQKQILTQLAIHTERSVQQWYHLIRWRFPYMKKQGWTQEQQMARYLELSKSQPQKAPANRDL